MSFVLLITWRYFWLRYGYYSRISRQTFPNNSWVSQISLTIPLGASLDQNFLKIKEIPVKWKMETLRISWAATKAKEMVLLIMVSFSDCLRVNMLQWFFPSLEITKYSMSSQRQLKVPTATSVKCRHNLNFRNSFLQYNYLSVRVMCGRNLWMVSPIQNTKYHNACSVTT